MKLAELETYLLSLKDELSRTDTNPITENLNNRLESSFENYKRQLERNYKYIMNKGNTNALKTLIAISKYEREQKESRKKNKEEYNDE